MRHLAFLSFALIAIMLAGCSADADTALPDMQWHYRVIATFPESGDQAQRMQQAFQSSPGLEERDIAWFVVGPDHITSNLADDKVPSRASLEKLHTVDGFQTVLVGKDGKLKASQLGGLNIQSLLDSIDQMPMRKQEMQQ
ncbi:DUF4174 domain-containing protein [Salinisphaera sp. Q1T1-3]|uniref:DUF4174 domain-containing protein n=1 Tax=Salinisphaera sp. Q1T1-3 TaxID=2321229 RepID=UPI000E76EAFF|nr:DUF4174 domain-containing protein [Salinisphaera sp. Q1T1-3]RJS92483.1 DUF4174 domain-containing protein [Salinisphaera sp. Q1T1-3]